MRCGGLVLAAGSGSRLGRPKALVEVGGERLVDRALAVLAAAGAAPAFVVAGAVDVGHVDAVVVHNDEWQSGLASSLRAGLRGVATYDAHVSRLDAVVITLVDMVVLTPAAVRRVVAAAESGARAAVATYNGQRGHPVLIRRADWADAARAATGDSGARQFLGQLGAAVVEVPCGDIASGLDIDTEADLAAARRRGGRLR